MSATCRMPEATDLDGTIRVCLLGDVDIAVRDSLLGCLTRLVGAGEDVVVDLRRTNFIDAGCCRILVDQATQAKSNGSSFGIARPVGDVRRMLVLTGAIDALPVHTPRPLLAG